jgi:hypothetical protein
VIGRKLKNASVPASVPVTPRVGLEKNPEGSETIIESEYCSVMGKALNPVTNFFVQGSNLVRELAKHFSNPGEEDRKAIKKFVGYLKEYQDDIKLTYRKPRELHVVSSVDSNYVMDKDDRRSVSGALHTVGGMLTNWMCKTQSNVLLSSTQTKFQSM